jgi:hypothetical protein
VGLEVTAAAEEIQRRARERVEQQRVDGEVPPTSRLLRRELRVALNGDTTVSGADLGVPPGDGDVDRSRHAFEAGELEDGEGLPHRVDAAERRQRRLEGRGGQPEDLDVEVLHAQAQESIAHGAADDERPPARLAQALQQAAQPAGNRKVHAGS